jgi:hypothetical protein
MVTVEDLLSLNQAAFLAGLKLPINEIELEVLEPGFLTHIQRPLPPRKMAIYLFFYGNQALKVGKVNTGSSPRYQYQHYSPNSNGSNLAKNLINSPQFIELIQDLEGVRGWMQQNLRRVNILFPAHLHRNILHFAEAFFILKLNPLFESGT